MDVAVVNADTRPISPTAVWVLVALANRPCHGYSVCSRIRGMSGMTVIPNRSTVRSAIRVLFDKGYLKEAYTEPGKGSSYDRRLYEITDSGWRMLKYERYRAMTMVRSMDTALAQLVLDTGNYRLRS
jgi:PadR family transcriptional regulator, regulatory protein PadR